MLKCNSICVMNCGDDCITTSLWLMIALCWCKWTFIAQTGIDTVRIWLMWNWSERHLLNVNRRDCHWIRVWFVAIVFMVLVPHILLCSCIRYGKATAVHICWYECSSSFRHHSQFVEVSHWLYHNIMFV